ncbi:MAG TPA: helix-turn-helix transcriptional regulator [Thermomicrobiales bacterium]|nr:helix-turn-helix transcriptional regulator [Thermomicrobiales bacterium]
MTPEQAFGHAVRVRRAERRLSQEGLALASGLDRAYISQLERGRQSPTLGTVFRLARALGLPPSDLLARAEAELAAPPEPAG